MRDGTNLYEVITVGNPQTEWQLWAIPRDGYPPTMMTSEVTDVRVPLDLTADGTHVYVSIGGPIDQALLGEILRVPVGTTDVEVFATDIHRPQVLREFGENIFWYEVEEIQDSGLMKGRLQRSPKDGTDARVLASITGATTLAVDDKFVYWVDIGKGLVWVQRVPHVGNNVITSMVVLEPAGPSLAIADDETYVYWSDQGFLASAAGVPRAESYAQEVTRLFVKICGVTNRQDAALAAAAGADAIGVNLWPGSKRYVEPAAARPLIDAIPAGVLKVGVFVDAPAAEVLRRLDELGLDRAQLHGDEAAADFAGLDPARLIRVVRVRDEGSFAAEAGWQPALWLYDAHVAGFGGAGVTAPWPLVAARGRRPFLLAGGLTPDNVAAAVAAVRPDGVDVASGVERGPGQKDPGKIAAFISAARAAFAAQAAAAARGAI